MKKYILLLIVMVSLLGFTTKSHAEYVGAYLGIVSPHDSGLTSTVSGVGIFTGEYKFDYGITLGGKIGKTYSFNKYFWGTELDINYQSFDTDTIHLSGVDISADGDISALFITGNAIIGYSGNKFKPYAGLGIGLARANIDINSLDSIPVIDGKMDDSTFGWLIIAGADFTVTPNIAIFAEYKYTGANFEFRFTFPNQTDEIDYRASLFSGGIKYLF